MGFKIAVLIVLPVLAIAFSACTPPSPNADLSQNPSPLANNNTPSSTSTIPSPNNLQNNQAQQNAPPNPDQGTLMKTLADFEQINAKTVHLNTSKGRISIELFGDKAPITVANFLNLAKTGFYDGIVFHRVIEDFMAQAGDPLSRDPSKESVWGSGGPGYVIPDEIDPELKHDSKGILSMANRGPNTGGSQFFITFTPTPWLDGKHTIFGKVSSGLDVLDQITQGDTITSVSYE